MVSINRINTSHSPAYPENLSRIIFTLTVSPMPYQMLRTKPSSIQGSSSPILRASQHDPSIEEAVVICSQRHAARVAAAVADMARSGSSPEGCLAAAVLLLLLGRGARSTRIGGSEARRGRVHGLAKVRLRHGGAGLLASGLALEGVKIVEAHIAEDQAREGRWSSGEADKSVVGKYVKKKLRCLSRSSSRGWLASVKSRAGSRDTWGEGGLHSPKGNRLLWWAATTGARGERRTGGARRTLLAGAAAERKTDDGGTRQRDPEECDRTPGARRD